MKKNKAEVGKWEELKEDCLVNVFGRVGVGSLLLDVPFVCKSWYKATLDPLCWRELNDLPNFEPYMSYPDPYAERLELRYRLHGELCETKFIKGIIDRSAGCATSLVLPFSCTKEALTYVADKCPALKKLVYCSEEESDVVNLSSVIGKFKYLESLHIYGELSKDVVAEIGMNCENFVSLRLDGYNYYYTDIGEEEATAIITYLPKIKSLALLYFCIRRENMIKILKGCRELVHLDVGGTRGFDEDDEEILKLASHIPSFNCSDSFRVYYSSDDSDSSTSGDDGDDGDNYFGF